MTCDCIHSGVRLRYRKRTIDDGSTLPWEPEEITLTDCALVAGSADIECASTSALSIGMQLDAVGLLPANSYVAAIVDSTHFTASYPATTYATGEEITAGNLWIKSWVGGPNSWYDASVGTGLGMNGLVETTRSSADRFTECEFEFYLTHGEVATRIEADWLRGDTGAVVSSLDPINLTVATPSSGILDAEIPADETVFSGMNLANIKIIVGPFL